MTGLRRERREPWSIFGQSWVLVAHENQVRKLGGHDHMDTYFENFFHPDAGSYDVGLLD